MSLQYHEGAPVYPGSAQVEYGNHQQSQPQSHSSSSGISKSNIQIRHLTQSQYIQSQNIPNTALVRQSNPDTPARYHLLEMKRDPSRDLKIHLQVPLQQQNIKKQSSKIDILVHKVSQLQKNLEIQCQQNWQNKSTISQLTSQLSQYERKMNFYEQERVSLQQHSHRAKRELLSVTQRMHDEIEKLNQEKLRVMHEQGSREVDLEREVNQLQLILQAEANKYARIISDHETNFRQLQSILENEKRNSQTLRSFISTQNAEIQALRSTEPSRTPHLVTSTQNPAEIEKLKAEIERLNSLISDKNLETNAIADSCKMEVEETIKHYEKSIKENINRWESERISKEKVISELNAKNSENEQKLNQFYCEMESLSRSLETVTQRYENDKKNHDISFKVIKQKNLELENKLQYHINETERLTSRLRDEMSSNQALQLGENSLQRENDTLKTNIFEKEQIIINFQDQLRNLQRVKNQSIDEVKRNFDLMKASSISKEIQQITFQFNTERVSLESKMRTLSEKNQELENKAAMMACEIQRLNKVMDFKSAEIDNLNQQNSSWESQVRNIANQRDSLQHKLEVSELTFQNQLRDVRIQFENEKTSIWQDREQTLKQESKDEQNHLLEQISKLEGVLVTRMMQHVLIAAEVENLRSEIHQFGPEKEKLELEWKSKIEHLKIQNEEKIAHMRIDHEDASNRLRREFEDRIQMIQEQQVRELNIRLQNEKENYENQTNTLYDEIQSLEQRLTAVVTENERLTFNNQQRMQELAELRGFLQELRAIRDLNNQLKDELVNKEIEAQKHQENFSKLENKLAMLATENERLSMLRNSEVEQNRNVNHQLRHELQEKNLFTSQLEREQRELQIRFENERLNWNTQTERQRAFYESEIQKQSDCLQSEVQRLTNVVEDQENSFQMLLNQLQTQTREKENQRVHLIRELEITHSQEVQRLMVEINHYSDTNNEVEQKLRFLERQNSRLQELSLQRMKLIEEWKKQNSGFDAEEYETMKIELDKLKSLNYEMEQKLLRTTSEVNRLKNQVNKGQEELVSKQQECERLYQLLHNRKLEGQNLNKQTINFKREINNLKERIRQFEANDLLKQEQIQKSQRENQQLKRINTSYRRQIKQSQPQTLELGYYSSRTKEENSFTSQLHVEKSVQSTNGGSFINMNDANFDSGKENIGMDFRDVENYSAFQKSFEDGMNHPKLTGHSIISNISEAKLNFEGVLSSIENQF